jgi:lipoate-protein ligase B
VYVSRDGVEAKIAAGVESAQRAHYHGLAINVAMDLTRSRTSTRAASRASRSRSFKTSASR